MTSIAATVVNRLLFLTGTKRIFSTPEKIPSALAKIRKKGPDLPSRRFRKKFDVSESEFDGQPVFTVRPRTTTTDKQKHVLYLHGGAYVMDIAWAHWGFIGRLIEATGVSVTVPLYRLAPEHKCAELIPAMQSLFAHLDGIYGAQNITVMGDSAGGGLSLALAQAIRDSGAPQPEHLVLLSPWLDVAASDPSQKALSKHDPMISLETLTANGEMYRGNLASDHPMVSPVYGTVENLPPIQIFTGTADTVFPDSRRFKAKMDQVGIVVDYREYRDMFHVWMLLPIPEGKKALGEIATFMKRNW